MTDENVTQQDGQNGQQQNPEGMVEDVKEPEGAGVASTPGDLDQQGMIFWQYLSSYLLEQKLFLNFCLSSFDQFSFFLTPAINAF